MGEGEVEGAKFKWEIFCVIGLQGRLAKGGGGISPGNVLVDEYRRSVKGEVFYKTGGKI